MFQAQADGQGPREAAPGASGQTSPRHCVRKPDPCKSGVHGPEADQEHGHWTCVDCGCGGILDRWRECGWWCCHVPEDEWGEELDGAGEEYGCSEPNEFRVHLV